MLVIRIKKDLDCCHSLVFVILESSFICVGSVNFAFVSFFLIIYNILLTQEDLYPKRKKGLESILANRLSSVFVSD